MDKNKIKHMLTLKSTWAIIISNIGLILNTAGVLDNIQLDKYRIISTSILIVAETIGLIHIYKTEPLPDKNNG